MSKDVTKKICGSPHKVGMLPFECDKDPGHKGKHHGVFMNERGRAICTWTDDEAIRASAKRLVLFIENLDNMIGDEHRALEDHTKDLRKLLEAKGVM